MNKKLIIYLVLILVAVIIVIAVIDSKKEKVLTKTEMDTLKSKYELMKEDFVSLAGKIDTKVASLMLDGSVYDDTTLANKVNEINKYLKENKLADIGVFEDNPFEGIFYLNTNGKVRFKFSDDTLVPSWISDDDVEHYFK